MPIRTASLTKRISANGQALHRAMMSRGDKDQPSEVESALLGERELLKKERDQRKAQALQPKPAIDRLVRTHRPEAKDKPKAGKDAQGADDIKKPKARKSRAEKHAEKAQAQDAARSRTKKPASK